MTNKEIRELSDKELQSLLREERLGLTKLRLKNAVNPIDNVMELKNGKRLIARLLTEKRRRELELS